MTTSMTSTASPPARRTRRQPQRSCVACGAQYDKRDLIRLTRVGDGGEARLVVDEAARAGGRGAYLCADPDCWTGALDGPGLARALRGALTASERETVRAFARQRFGEEHAR